MIKFYERNIWYLENNIWVNYSAEYGADAEVGKVIAARNSISYKTAQDRITAAKVSRVKSMDKNVLLVFKNGYIDKKLKFTPGIIPFTTSQIGFDYIEKPTVHPDMEKYINWFTGGDINKRKSALATAMTLLTSRNEGVLGIFYSKKGGTGKTQFLSLYKEMARSAIKNINTQTVFNHSGKFSLTGSKGKTGLIGDELPTTIDKIAADRIKDIIDPGKKHREIEDKGENSGETSNMVNMVITTNRISSWYEVDNALKSRVNVLYINPDTSATAVFPEELFFEMRETEEAIKYLLALSVNAYIEAHQTKKFRADKFRFGLKDTDNYWAEVLEEHSSSNDFLNFESFGGKTIREMIEVDREEFIPNSFVKDLFIEWGKVSKSKISLLNIKKEIISWGEENGYLIDKSAIKTVDGKSQRGMSITLTKIEKEKIEEVKKRKEEMLNKQALEAEAYEKAMRESYGDEW